MICFLAYIIIGTNLNQGFGQAEIGAFAQGTADLGWLAAFAIAYVLCMFVFIAGMLMRAYRAYNRSLLAAYVVFFNMQVLLLVGFILFPMRGSYVSAAKVNIAHGVAVALAAVAAVVFAFLAGAGYHRQAEHRRLGIHCLLWGIALSVVSVAGVVLGCLNAGYFGMAERAMLFVLMGLIASISYTETFMATRYNRIRKNES